MLASGGSLNVDAGATNTLNGTLTLVANSVIDVIDLGSTLNIAGNVTVIGNSTILVGQALNVSGNIAFVVPAELSVTNNVGAAPNVSFSGVLTGPAGSSFSLTPALGDLMQTTISAVSNAFAGTVTVGTGTTLVVTGSIPASTISFAATSADGATLTTNTNGGASTGTVGIIEYAVGAGGTVEPGSASLAGTLNATTATFAASPLGNFFVNINSDTSADRLAATGAVNLTAQPSLQVGLNFASPTVGDVFTIITGSAVTGQFAGLPDGSTIVVAGTTFRINYTGTAVTLTVVSTATTTTVVATPSTAAPCQSITLTATVVQTGTTTPVTEHRHVLYWIG